MTKPCTRRMCLQPTSVRACVQVAEMRELLEDGMYIEVAQAIEEWIEHLRRQPLQHVQQRAPSARGMGLMCFR